MGCGGGCGGCGDSDSTPSTVERLTPPPNEGRAGYSVKVSADFTADRLVRQVQVFPPATSPPASIEIVFPLNPTPSQPFTVVAAGINVTLDGNTNVISGSSSLASGSAKTWFFASNAFDADPSQPGTWYPES